MSKKARRRPSWKRWKRMEDILVLNLLNEEDGSLIETIRISGLGHMGRNLIRDYGRAEAEQIIRGFLIDTARKIVIESVK